jgi:hypothetical protein
MYIHVDDTGRFDAHEVENLNALKLVTRLTVPQLLSAFDRQPTFGFLANADHVWMARDWLLAQGPPGDESWTHKFQKMLDYARSKGWMHPLFPMVRVHVERPAA